MVRRLISYLPVKLLIALGLYGYLNNQELLKHYKSVGNEVGGMIYDRHLGLPGGYYGLLQNLIVIEYEVVERGFRSVPMFLFTHLPKEDLHVPKMVQGEKSIHFASIWQKTTSKTNIFGDFLARAMNHQGPLIENRVDDKDIFLIEREVLRKVPNLPIVSAF